MNRFTRSLRDKFPSLFLSLAIFFFGWMLGTAGFNLNLRLNPPGVSIEYKSIPSSKIDFSLLGEVLSSINSKFLFRPIDGQKLLYGAVSGLVNALGDPYSVFLNPEENAEFQDQLEGRYEGIGAELDVRDDQLIIVAPLEGSPAEAMGVRAGDKILEIEGESTEGITVYEAVTKIRGATGTVSTLTLQRGDEEPFEVKITRAEVALESVRFEDKGGGVCYLRVSRFGEGTLGEWDGAVAEVVSRRQSGAGCTRGVVLDLRGNPGGFLNGAVYLASEFISSGVVTIEESAGGARQSLRVQTTKNGQALVGVTTIVLINEGSASASEILAAALNERVGAMLVGKTSFGKGTVQEAAELTGGSGLHLTVAKWLTPSGKWIHQIGLAPNYEVELTDEDINADRDPQLDRALELLH